MTCIVYRLTNTSNNKIYFGITEKALNLRFAEHCRGRDNTYVQNSIRKYGKGTFNMCEMYVFDSVPEAKSTEIYLISKYKSNMKRYPNNNGMNMTDGGDGCMGYSHTTKTKILLSVSQKGKTISQDQIDKLQEGWRNYVLKNGHPRLGSSPSEITRDKMRTSHIDNPKTCNSVFQYSVDGVFIKEYISARSASYHVSVAAAAIKSAVRNNILSDGYQWFYEYKGIKVPKYKRKYTNKEVHQYTLDGIYLKSFTSVRQAEMDTGFKHISSVCTGKRKRAGGFIWRYTR